MDYYCLFLDPETQIYYRKVIGRDDFIRIEPLDDQHKTSGPSASEQSSLDNSPVSQIKS
jgi:hypothetical protein